MIQINISALEQCLDFLVGAVATIDGILAVIIFVGRPGYNELRVGNDFKRIGTGLVKSEGCIESNVKVPTKSMISRK
jgi:hypothetical protein